MSLSERRWEGYKLGGKGRIIAVVSRVGVDYRPLNTRNRCVEKSMHGIAPTQTPFHVVAIHLQVPTISALRNPVPVITCI